MNPEDLSPVKGVPLPGRIPRRRQRQVREPWDRRAREPKQTYEAFQAYCGLGGARTLSAMAALYGHGAQKWSCRWEWPARAKAFDLWEERRLRGASEDDKRSAKTRQTELGALMQQKAREMLLACRVSDVTPAAIAGLAKVGFEIERTSLGEATIVEEHRVPDEVLAWYRESVQRMSEDDLAQKLAAVDRQLTGLQGTAGQGDREPSEN